MSSTKRNALDVMKKNGTVGNLQAEYVCEVAKLIQETEIDALKMSKKLNVSREYKLADDIVFQYLESFNMKYTIDTILAECKVDNFGKNFNDASEILKVNKDSLWLKCILNGRSGDKSVIKDSSHSPLKQETKNSISGLSLSGDASSDNNKNKRKSLGNKNTSQLPNKSQTSSKGSVLIQLPASESESESVSMGSKSSKRLKKKKSTSRKSSKSEKNNSTEVFPSNIADENKTTNPSLDIDLDNNMSNSEVTKSPLPSKSSIKENSPGRKPESSISINDINFDESDLNNTPTTFARNTVPTTVTTQNVAESKQKEEQTSSFNINIDDLDLEVSDQANDAHKTPVGVTPKKNNELKPNEKNDKSDSSIADLDIDDIPSIPLINQTSD